MLELEGRTLEFSVQKGVRTELTGKLCLYFVTLSLPLA